jgi:hypothetical protein
MDFYHNQKLAWLAIPKNASTSLREIFDRQLGWLRDDLYNPKIDLDKLEFFACLRHPDARHTMGVAQYLTVWKLTKILDEYPQILASSIFDENSMPLHFLIPQTVLDRCTFFVIDDAQSPWPGHLVSWLKVRGIELSGPIPWINSSRESHDAMRQKIKEIKQRFPHHHNKLTKWAHERDMLLYARHVRIQHTLAPKVRL